MRTVLRTGGLLVALAFFAVPASAQIVQALHIGAGVFVPRGYDGRVGGDVLVEDLRDQDFRGCETSPISDCIYRFTGGQVFGEWLIGFGNHVEIGAGLGFYSRGVPSYYRDYTFPDNSDIQQHLDLRVVPITGLVRFLAGRPGTFQPYVGFGVSALNYRYTESGTFIDFNQLDTTGAFVTFDDRFIASGTAVGPLILAGFRVPINGDIWGFTTEWRYQGGSGKTGGLANGFLGDRIDLGGNQVNFGLLVRF